MSAPKGYSATQIRLHWLVFLLLIVQYVFHEAIVESRETISKGMEAEFNPMTMSHVVIGGLIFLIVAWRLALRFTRGAPPAPEKEPAILKLLAVATHLLLYALLILLPISGAVAWFGGVEAAAAGHSVMRIALLALVALHVAGALYHQFVLKTDVLMRMRKPQA